MRAKRARTMVGVGLIVVFAVLLVGYVTLVWARHSAIESVCTNVQAVYVGDRVEALVEYLLSDEPTLEEKNRVVWVLGELRDERALPALESLLASRECDHTRFVCQREVVKAIHKINGDTPNPYPWERRNKA